MCSAVGILPAVGQELVKLGGGRGRQAAEDVGEVAVDVQVVALSTGDEAEYRSGGFSAGLAAGKNPDGMTFL